MGYEDVELSVLLTTDLEIADLNQRYRKKQSATDVLSFSQNEGGAGANTAKHLGDLVISLETCARQAKEFKVSFMEELHRLLVHGLLHLLGYDHENVSQAEAKRMQKKEKELLESIKNARL